jgi:hypothetical protein
MIWLQSASYRSKNEEGMSMRNSTRAAKEIPQEFATYILEAAV